MNLRFVPAIGCVWLFVLAGCGTIDVAPAGNVARVVNGTIRADLPLPPSTEIVVRVIETSNRPLRAPADLPLGDRAMPAIPAAERVLGEQVQRLVAATSEPVPFQVEFQADDATLRRGLNLDVRVSAGGRVRFRTVNAHVVTLSSSPFPQEIAVQAVDR